MQFAAKLLVVLCACASTRGASAAPWSFAVCGDNRGDEVGVFPEILARVSRDAPEFLIHAGDMVETGRSTEWRAFVESAAHFDRCILPIIGNHELRVDQGARNFLRSFDLVSSSYAFDHRDGHFVILDNGSERVADDVVGWLRRDLDAHRKGPGGPRFIVVGMHIPPAVGTIRTHVSGGPEDYQRYQEQSRRLFALLKSYGVDLIIAAHEHTARITEVEGVQVLIAGAAGADQGPGSPRYGYHLISVTESGRLDPMFVDVLPGQAPAAPKSSHLSLSRRCPAIQPGPL